MSVLHTPRLELRPVTIEVVDAVLAGRRRTEIEALVGAEMPWAWPGRALLEQVFKASLEAIHADPEKRLWGDRLMITREAPRRVVGSVVFRGRPDAAGRCEIAYGVEDGAQNKGYATEALSAIVAWAMEQPECRTIEAMTMPWHKASARVLEKIGMTASGKRLDPKNGEMLVYALTRG